MASLVQSAYDLGAPTSAVSRDLVMTSAAGRALTNGSNLLIWVAQTAAATRTYTCSDGTNTYTSAVQAAGATSRAVALLYAENITGGDKTITVGHGAGATSFTCGVIEVSGLKTSASLDDFDSNEEASVVTTHQCAPAGQIDVTGAGIILAVSASNASWGTYTKNANFTALGNSTTYAAQYRIVTGATNDQDGEFTTSTARASINAIAAFLDAAGGGSYNYQNALLTLGVGA